MKTYRIVRRDGPRHFELGAYANRHQAYQAWVNRRGLWPHSIGCVLVWQALISKARNGVHIVAVG